MHKNRNQRPDGYNQFLIALALGTMISAVALFFIEYFGIIDVVKGWPYPTTSAPQTAPFRFTRLIRTCEKCLLLPDILLPELVRLTDMHDIIDYKWK
jgi:hypothetical protein